MNTHRIAKLLAGAVVAGGFLGVPAVAMASTPSSATSSTSSTSSPHGASFEAAKKAVETRLAWRQQRLANLTTEVTDATNLTSSDRSTLSGDLANETAGIAALVAKVPNDTTWAELQADAKAMVVDYRVFVVMSPQVHETIAADTAGAIEQKLTAAEPQIEALISYEQSQGKDVAAAQTAYEDLVTQVSDASTDTSGISAAVLATSPSAYPGNASIFTNARSSLEQARTALGTARSDLQTIAKVLGV